MRSENKMVSIFDQPNFINSSQKVWEKYTQQDFQNHIIEYQFECARISHSQKILKPLTLQLGESALYYVKNNQPQGVLPLTFTTMITEIREQTMILRFKRNNKCLELKLEYNEEILKLLSQKCVLRTFYEDYQVEKKIGKGNFASVFLVTHKKSGKKYAVKAFSKAQILVEQKGKESLENEIKIMKKLKQENLLHLHYVYETDNSIYFIMDLLEGGELFKRIRTSFLSSKTVQQLMYNLLKALSYMHQKKCMHRDLKPQNLLLKSSQSDTDIVIADFGLGMLLNDEPLFKRCGTPGFVAPEILNYQIGCKFYNEKCDIFSAGAIFYMLVTGNCPFRGVDAIEILEKNKQCEINFYVTAIEKASSKLRNLLKNMLNVNPSHRLSAEQCLQHPYFEELFDPNDLIEYPEGFTQENDFLINGIQQANVDSGKGSFQLVQKESPWNGKVETVESFSERSHHCSPNLKQTPLSKFGKFNSNLTEFHRNVQAANKFSNQQSLHKMALKNSYQKKIQSKDDDYVPEDSVPELDNYVQELKKQIPKVGHFRKSNTCELQS